MRIYEFGIELTYQANIPPDWIIHLEVQYIAYHGGASLNSLNPSTRIANTAAIGLHTTALI